MIHDLANAISKHPFNMTKGANYLHAWVDERLVHASPLKVDILSMVDPRSTSRMSARPSTAVVGLEPAVSTIQVHSAASAAGPATTPKMIVIGGMATTLKRTAGLTWTEAFNKAYELWGKLHTNVALSLEIPEGNVPHMDSTGEDMANDVIEQPPEEDDLSVPLEDSVRGEF